MRRRTFLASASALLASPVVSTATGAPATAYGPLGHVGLDGTTDAVVDDSTAYVAVQDGMATVDISDPAEPRVLAERRGLLADAEDGPLEQIQDVAIDGDRLIAAGPANPNPGAVNGLVVFDVSDPGVPEQVAVHRTDFSIHNLDAADGVAYLTGNNGADNPLVAVDLTTEEPTELGRWSLFDADDAWSTVPGSLRTLHDVTVHDGRAYLAYWDAGTWIVDVSDPTDISLVSRVRGESIATLTDDEGPSGAAAYVQLPGNDHYVDVDEDASLLAVGAEAWDLPNDDIEGGPGGIELFDISDPTDPVPRGFIEPPETADASFGGEWVTSHNFDIADGRLYSSWYVGGVTVHDVSDPTSPRKLAHWQDRDTAEFFTAQRVDGKPYFVGSSFGGGSAGSTVAGAIYTFPTVESDDPVPTETTTERPPTTTTQAPTTTTTTTTTEPPATTTASGDGPGFGPLSTLAALLAGGYYAQRRRGDDEQ